MKPVCQQPPSSLARREFLVLGAGAIGFSTRSRQGLAEEPGLPLPGGGSPPFVFGLNTSTIRGQMLSIVEIIDIASRAGYQGMEPWLDELTRYADSGGSLPDLGKRFRDAGITVESVIDFFEWAVDDPGRRAKALESARRSMEIVRQVGGRRIAAPPVGATDVHLDPLRVAERYRELLELGDAFGVVPQVEVWGFSQTLGRLGEAALVAIESGHPKACILPDVYHLHRGGSAFEGVRLLSPAAIHVLHVNDYPATIPRERLTDADRIYPGDGAAPYGELLRNLAAGGFRLMLSLELFNRELWTQDPGAVARTGLEKMKAVVQASIPASG